MFPRLLGLLSLLLLSQVSLSQQSSKASVPARGGMVIVALGDASYAIIIDFSNPNLRNPLAELEMPPHLVGVPVGESGHITVRNALAAAQGTHPIAALSPDAAINRGYKMIPIDLKRILEGRTADFNLNAFDILFVTRLKRSNDVCSPTCFYDPPLWSCHLPR